jgi:hypothetical protein
VRSPRGRVTLHRDPAHNDERGWWFAYASGGYATGREALENRSGSGRASTT